MDIKRQINPENSSMSWQSDENDEMLNDALNKCENDVLCVLNGTKIRLIENEILNTPQFRTTARPKRRSIKQRNIKRRKNKRK